MRRIKRFVAVLGACLLSWPAAALDEEKAKEIYGPCAACHGEFGAGGKKGEYPRIAGQQPKYMYQQLKNFQSQARINLPMYPYTKERDLPDEDMRLVSDWLAQIQLPTRMPTFKGDEDALTRLQMVEKVMLVPRVEGDIDKGGQLYQKQCASCHGKQGQGKGMFPMLVGQYTNYLQKQLGAFLRAERPHDEDSAKEGVLFGLQAADLQDIVAYLTTLQNQE
ncbi:MAG TPA: c-type cytochrome [Azospira sp.]|nr:c-type cytochrome [Azospira sp.]